MQLTVCHLGEIPAESSGNITTIIRFRKVQEAETAGKKRQVLCREAQDSSAIEKIIKSAD